MTPSSCEDVYLDASEGNERDPRDQSRHPSLAFCGHEGPLPASESDGDSAAGPSYQEAECCRGREGAVHGDPSAVLVASQRLGSTPQRRRTLTLRALRNPRHMEVSSLFRLSQVQDTS
jgi:hypothetical protein